MGCAQSKIDHEEAVSRCKDRKLIMKDAVSARNAFSAAHSAYTIALKDTGGALSDYGEGEVQNFRPSPTLAKAPTESLPLPPPPLPDDFSPTPLQRSASMPSFPKRCVPPVGDHQEDTILEEDDMRSIEETGGGELQGKVNRSISSSSPPSSHQKSIPSPPHPPESTAWEYFFSEISGDSSNAGQKGIQTENGGENQYENFTRKGDISDDVAPQTPPQEKVVIPPAKPVKKQKQNIPPSVQTEPKRGHKTTGSNANLLHMLKQLDDHFLEASDCAREVSKMLEANKLHYHSNFADNRGYIDHSARVMRVITWNRSFRGIPNADKDKDDFDSEESETHATVLDKLLAWEKKLYDEVKAGELLKIEYQKKVALLNKQKKRGSNPDALEKTKAAVSHLHTRYIVDMQSMDSTVSEIQRLRDSQLYPKLVDLVDEMAKMWDGMHKHHDIQWKIASELKGLDITNASKETTDHHHERTIQLWRIANEWHLQFQKLISRQKEYILALDHWLKLNLIPIESSLKEKVSSPPRIQDPPIKALLQDWHAELETLPDVLAKNAIGSFVNVINAIVAHQQEELKLKEKCKETQKEFERKSREFEHWHQKYLQKKTPSEEVDSVANEETNDTDPVSERQFPVNALKAKLENEVAEYQNFCKQVREKSLGSLKSHLPELFRAMLDFSKSCSEMYKKLQSISRTPKFSDSQ